MVDASAHKNIGLSPLGLLVLQPSPFCNIDCSYCYLPDRSSTVRMKMTTVAAIADFITTMPVARPSLSVVWHAGEPLSVPVSFYAEAFERFASAALPFSVRHHFQTNATLVSAEWCALIRQWNVCVGISIDGPRKIHDAYRVDRRGRGTFDKTMKGIECLRAHQIPFTILCVITRASLDARSDLFDFLATLGATHIGFNVEEVEGIHDRTSLSGAGLQESMRGFYRELAQVCRSTPRVRVRELEDMRRHLTAPPGSEVERANNRAGAILSVDTDGNYCTYSPELLGNSHPKYGRLAWGNVHTDSWHSIAYNPAMAGVRGEIEAGVDLCRTRCEYFPVCGGGNPSNKLAELGTFAGSETQYCRLHVQAVADVAIEQLEAELGAAS